MTDQARHMPQGEQCACASHLGCGLLRHAPKTTLEQAYVLGCRRIRWLVDVWPHEQEVVQ